MILYSTERQKRRLLAPAASEFTPWLGWELGPHALLVSEGETIRQFGQFCSLLVGPRAHVGQLI